MENSKWYNSVRLKDNCALFALTPYFRALAIRWCHLNFSLPTPVAMATNRSYSKTKLTAAQHVLKCLRHFYITHNFFLAATFLPLRGYSENSE